MGTMQRRKREKRERAGLVRPKVTTLKAFFRRSERVVRKVMQQARIIRARLYLDKPRVAYPSIQPACAIQIEALGPCRLSSDEIETMLNGAVRDAGSRVVLQPA